MSVAAPTTTRVESRATPLLSQRIAIMLSGAALIAAVIGVTYAAVLAIRWNSLPFPGFLTSSQLVVSSIRPVQDGTWPGINAGIRTNDRLLGMTSDITLPEPISFDGMNNPSAAYLETLSRMVTGENVTFEMLRPASVSPGCDSLISATGDGAICAFTFRVGKLTTGDFIIQFGIGLVVAIVLIIIGGVVYALRRHQPTARLAAVICAAGAVIAVQRFENVTTFQSVLLSPLLLCLLAGVFVQLSLTFPSPSLLVRRQPMIQVIPVALAVVGMALCVIFFRLNDPRTLDGPQILGIAFAVIGALTLVVTLERRRRRSASAVLRDQATIVLLGMAVALVPAVLWLVTYIAEQLGQQAGVNLTGLNFSSAYILPPMVLFPLSLAYAVLQYRMFDTDRIISESFIYTALGAMLIVGYLLVTGAAYYITAGILRADNPVMIAGTLFVIALLFSPIRLRLEEAVDRSFFRQRRAYEKRVELFSRSLTASVELSDAVEKLAKQLDETVSPRYLFVFLRNLQTGEYEAYADSETGKTETDIHFAANSPLVGMLAGDQSLIYLESGHSMPPELISERARLAVLNTPVIVRLQSLNKLNGFIAIGPRQDNSSFGYEDLRFIESLAEQAASAFERAQMIIEAQRNERELRVLAQVSAALNIAMDFDTLLEFVYTQVDKIIHAPNFYIALREEQTDELYYAFYQEQGERVPEREGYRWRIGRDLMSEIVRTGQPIKTDNYVQEMNKRDTRLHVENTSLRAWMGVPLNAGTGNALGVLAIATTDGAISYTEDQIRIFWNIGDLAATAIYKTRLFGQTEERARQMKVLNDISSKLGSEFEHLDSLLQVITESAVEILRGEAGSLLLRDEATSDLIFQLAVGGAGQELVGSRIPAGSGIAGTVVETGRHVIVNDTQQDNRWYGDINPQNPQQQRKFSTRAIVAVPLTTRGGVIGVLEVINKKDGTAFGEDEVNLLTAFAGQAAVAIENARLFQMTDQALAERVQQLDNMQRIDQELNRTLDFDRVVELTIDNAIREAGADTGVLALVSLDPLRFQIADSIGYPPDVFAPRQFYPITFGIMGRVYRTGQPALITKVEMADDRDYIETLPGTQSQLAVPLLTAGQITAVLVLESMRSDAFNMVTASFIKGLAEHANTAITNSQLFARLDEANQSRSKFVGFVAHELKNPMASIKGYAEVLLGGMTGQLNEQQQNFIAVIRRNVTRMQQLVDDLRDLTAQETGNLTLKMAPVSFTNIIVETLRPQQRAIDEKEQQVILNVPENLPMVWGDELRLIQVMTNFVSNANKYTPQSGKITILAEHVPNQWDENGAPEVVHCAVVDTGIGMSEEDLHKLFTPYWRSDNPRAQEQPGTGLGMTLTRGLIEAHGGKIWVESTLDVGTTFHMTVPLAKEEEKVSSTSR